VPFSLYVLASGSKANAYLLSDGSKRILIDAGLGIRSMTAALGAAAVRFDQIAAVFITHDHTDHVRGLGKLLEKSRAPLYASAGTLAAVDYMVPARIHTVPLNGDGVEIGSFAVQGIPVPHDAAGPMAYFVENGRHRVTVATDLGEVPRSLAAALARSTAAVLESNHDVQMLKNGPYPEILKQRILSGTGHLSNVQTAAALAACRGNGLAHVVLAHISDENNDPLLARAASAAALDSGETTLHLSSRSSSGPFLQLDGATTMFIP
jgi:phosphoribosyl 1,2-cyclic phosphodiesterase